MKAVHSIHWSWFCLAVSVLPLAPACAPPTDALTVPPPPEGTVLPILSDIGLIVDARINGHDTRVMLDTGTVLTSLASPSAIERLGLEAGGANPVAGAEEDMGVGVCGAAPVVLDETRYIARRLELGNVVFENVGLTVMHETGYDTFAENGVDLFLAAQLLMDTDWRIEAGGHRLVLLPLNSRARPAEAMDLRVVGPTVVPFSDLKVGVMSLAVSYGGAEPRDTLIDTGGSAFLAMGSEAAGQAGWDAAALPHVSTEVTAAGATCNQTLFRAPGITLGGHTYQRPLALDVGDGGPLALVGWYFITAHESVYVAPGGGWIEFTRNATTDALVAEPLRSFGLGIVSNGAGGYVVNGVLEGFSAAEQGVRAGDVVLQVNGVSVDTVEGKSLLFGPAPLRAGQADFLIQDAAGGQRTVTLTARVMLE